MGLDIYISRKTASGKECLIHWHKYGPLAEWFKEKIYHGEMDCNERPLDYLALVFLRCLLRCPCRCSEMPVRYTISALFSPPGARAHSVPPGNSKKAPR